MYDSGSRSVGVDPGSDSGRVFLTTKFSNSMARGFAAVEKPNVAVCTSSRYRNFL